ncbi:hypothetical protein DICSQDRAFT_113517 [Dichomitus squalens LYAD-421 SS1]|uniref:DUF2470 domain-containing protein n=1 Tax=Dichomitus squalens (strain LYAD-421) TaxID=732165 RepID=R7SIV5_DICSQ|nr:uncharacterized protein DICSQDRAFT_113517 [Dichomitus squalens LYAD-421 SS1]EJF56074.1 hypothetical protein DICSQDRAFT_113517 [Dichomitus squalens LYAD-421 SS1]
MASDPVADKSGFLCMYMSNHPDTLVSYVRYWGKVKEAVSTAKLTSIDTKGMNLTYQTKGSTATKEIRVQFDPPLAGYDEVKPRLIAMKAEAEEELGMVKAPQITSFKFHPQMVVTAVAVSFLVYTTYASSLKHAPYNPYFAPGNIILSFFPSWMLRFSWGLLAVFHGFESLYVAYLCRKHSTGLVVGFQYWLAALILGFPAIISIRQQVQEARIASILKGQ